MGFRKINEDLDDGIYEFGIEIFERMRRENPEIEKLNVSELTKYVLGWWYLKGMWIGEKNELNIFNFEEKKRYI